MVQDSQHQSLHRSARLSVAPMMDWTDRHCRYLHRLMSRDTLLYTEMVTSPALVRGGALHLLDYNPEEHPVALQLGGSDPAELAAAAKDTTTTHTRVRFTLRRESASPASPR